MCVWVDGCGCGCFYVCVGVCFQAYIQFVSEYAQIEISSHVPQRILLTTIFFPILSTTPTLPSIHLALHPHPPYQPQETTRSST